MAEPLLVLRTDQAAATQAAGLKAVALAARNLYYELQKQKLLMRSGFDDSDPENIDWTQLETLWGCPVGVSGEVLWALVNGTLILLDSDSGNSDFQKLIRRVV